jgi:hypothetical protein
LGNTGRGEFKASEGAVLIKMGSEAKAKFFAAALIDTCHENGSFSMAAPQFFGHVLENKLRSNRKT